MLPASSKRTALKCCNTFSLLQIIMPFAKNASQFPAQCPYTTHTPVAVHCALVPWGMPASLMDRLHCAVLPNREASFTAAIAAAAAATVSSQLHTLNACSVSVEDLTADKAQQGQQKGFTP
jgi:hypothetical protein